MMCFAHSAWAQVYSLDWWKVAGGGGTSTGGVYTLSSTIGQVDAGTVMTNQLFSLTGGFWVFPSTVQSVGAPTLTVTAPTAGLVRISWSPPTPGYTLQMTANLAGTNWVVAPTSTNNPANLTSGAAARFYRLQRTSP